MGGSTHYTVFFAADDETVSPACERHHVISQFVMHLWLAKVLQVVEHTV